MKEKLFLVYLVCDIEFNYLNYIEHIFALRIITIYERLCLGFKLNVSILEKCMISK